MQLNIFLLFLLVLVKGDDQPLYKTLSGREATGNYSNSEYLTSNQIQNDDFQIHTIGDLPNHTIDHAFDNNDKTHWVGNVSVREGTPYPLTFNFTKLQCIEAIIYKPAYFTGEDKITRRYDGFPLVLKVYISIGGSPYQLKYIFNTNPKNTDIWDAVQMVFTNPIWCDNLKLEFVNVTRHYYFRDDYAPASQDIYLMKAKLNNTKRASDTLFEGKRISKSDFSCETGGDQDDHPIEYAFQSATINKLQHWAAENPNNESFNNYLIFNFTKHQFIDSVAYWAAFSTNRDASPLTRRYDGFPLQLSIYASIVSDQYKFVYLHNGMPPETGQNEADLWESVHFQFDQPVLCKQLKLVFEYVTKDVIFGNDLTPAAKRIALIPSELTMSFSISESFTLSEFFTLSESFTKSKSFSTSESFTLSESFSYSEDFTLSNQFSSYYFSLSSQFTYSKLFTLSASFSISHTFSFSDLFTPLSRPIGDGNSGSNKSKQLAMIIGIVIAVIAVLLILVVLFIFLVIRRKGKMDKEEELYEEPREHFNSESISDLFDLVPKDNQNAPIEMNSEVQDVFNIMDLSEGLKSE